MLTLFQDAGVFIWPLALCSLLATFIVIERLIALRDGKTIPRELEEAFVRGKMPKNFTVDSTAGRIVQFFQNRTPDADQLKAFARLQIIRMERGLFLLDTVVSAAPLIGLLGTVTGLVQVFSRISPDTGLPDPSAFVQGVAMALSTTMLGLAVAIPALVFGNYLNRRIDTIAAKIDVGVERMLGADRAHPETSA